MKEEICERVDILELIEQIYFCNSLDQVQLGVALPSRHFSALWQNCLLAPPDVQLISQEDCQHILKSSEHEHAG